MKLSEIKSNPNNPRVIKDESFQALVKSLKEFPKMMEVRPIVIDENGIIMGGNQRFRALQELGYKEVPDSWIKQYENFTPEEWQEFVIKDNIGFGQWNWEQLNSEEWNVDELNRWGLKVEGIEKNIDVDSFFIDKEEDKSEDKSKIILEYTLDDYEKINIMFSKYKNKTKEQVVFELLENADKE